MRNTRVLLNTFTLNYCYFWKMFYCGKKYVLQQVFLCESLEKIHLPCNILHIRPSFSTYIQKVNECIKAIFSNDTLVRRNKAKLKCILND